MNPYFWILCNHDKSCWRIWFIGMKMLTIWWEEKQQLYTHRSVLFFSSFSFMVVVVVVVAGIVFVWVFVSSLKVFHRNWSVFRIRNISYLLTWLKTSSCLHKFIWIKGYLQLRVSTHGKQKWERKLLDSDLHSTRLPHMLNTLPLTHTWTNPNGKKRSVCPWEP